MVPELRVVYERFARCHRVTNQQERGFDIHHREPYAAGGEASVKNIELPRAQPA